MDLIVLLILGIALCVCDARMVVPSFHWTARNPLFRKDVVPRRPCTDPAHLFVEPKAELYFVCPHVAIDVVSSKMDRPEKDELYENVHLVSKKGYDTCTLDQPESLLLNCDKPEYILQLKFELLAFRKFTHNGLWQFMPNTTYYFINTSDGTKKGLNNKSGGRCKTHNMKLKVHVCAKGENCAKCEGMCCERPPTTLPPTTTRITTTTTASTTTTTRKVTNATTLPTTTKLHKPLDNEWNLPESSNPEKVSTVSKSNNSIEEKKPLPTQQPAIFLTQNISNDLPIKTVFVKQPEVKPPSPARSGSPDNGRTSNSGSTTERFLFIFCGMIIGVVLSVAAFYSWRKYQDFRSRNESPEKPPIDAVAV